MNNETTVTPIDSIPLKEKQQPVGEVVIGSQNPTEMTETEFANCPELLFHGASGLFTFRRDFNYDTDQHLLHSHTVGRGFYCTPKREDAELYSEAFGTQGQNVVLELLPYQARMFDFRSQSDLATNAPVPQELMSAYVEYYTQIFNQRWGNYDSKAVQEILQNYRKNLTFQNSVNKPTTLDNFFAPVTRPQDSSMDEVAEKDMKYSDAKNYLNFLKVFKDHPTDLREMLSKNRTINASEYGSKVFAEFMVSQGFDGVIYTEGGDHQLHNNPVSYVFYNLSKIGTFDTWNA